MKQTKRRREVPLQVRVTAVEMDQFRHASEKAGLSLSAWARERLLRCAADENGDAARGAKPPRVPRS